jgi:SAM-dependent methyltransferase
LHAAGLRIVELPIPTYYGDEICRVNGMQYAAHVVASVLRYEAHELGLQHYPEYEAQPNYTLKKSRLSSHSQLLDMVGPPKQRVLDIGCGRGELGHALSQRGHHVVGLDQHPPAEQLDTLYEANLFDGLPDEVVGERFDTILFADVLEHLPDPDVLLSQAAGLLSDNGKILVSLPNAVHWTVRAQVAAGRFDYANKGIMDRGHPAMTASTGSSAMASYSGSLRVSIPSPVLSPPRPPSVTRTNSKKTKVTPARNAALVPTRSATRLLSEPSLPRPEKNPATDVLAIKTASSGMG